MELQKRAGVELQRPVTIGSLRVSLWGGLGARVSDIRVGASGESDAAGTDASIESIDIKVRFWPLFRGEYVVDRLIVERPQIEIRSGKKPGSLAGDIRGDSEADNTGVKLALGGLSFGKLEIHDGSFVKVATESDSKLAISGIEFDGMLDDSGAANSYRSAGTISFKSVAISGENDSTSVTLPATSFTYQVNFDTATQSLALEKVEAAVADGHFSLAGGIALAGPEVVADSLSITGEAPLALLDGMLPEAGNVEFGGKFDVNLSLAGSLTNMEQLRVRGHLGIVGGSFSSPAAAEGLEALDADLSIQPDRIEIRKLALQFSESDLALTGVITNPFPYLLPVSQKIRENATGPFLQFSATSRKLNIDRLFPEAAPGADGRQSVPEGGPVGIPIILPEVNGAGTVSIDTLIYADVHFTDVAADVRIERRRIFCENVRGRSFGGAIDGKALIDLTDFARPHYSGSYAAHDIQASDFIERFALWNGSGLLTGSMSANGTYSASGWEKKDFLAGLSMDMFSSADSLLLTSETISNALTSTIKRVSGASSLRSNYKTLNLRSLKSRIRFVNGHVQIDTLRGFSDEVGSWRLNGAVGLDGSLAVKGDLTPTQEMIAALTEKNTVAGAVAALLKTSPEGAVNLPFAVSGTMEKPILSIDKNALSKALNKTLKERGGSILKGLFQKP